MVTAACNEDDWEKWWKISEDGGKPRHLYFLGKDNIPFHTVIWPALIMGLNHASKDWTLTLHLACRSW